MSSDTKYVIRGFLAIFGSFMTCGGLYMLMSAIPQQVIEQNGGWVIAMLVGLAMLAAFFWSTRRR